MSKVPMKKNRMLEIFFRGIKGEDLSVRKLADEYQVSTKSISRDINEIKNFLSESREIVGNTELRYVGATKTYSLEFDDFLLSKELMAMVEMMIGARAFSKTQLLEIIRKLKCFTSRTDSKLLDSLIAKEIYHYNEVKHDCHNVIDNMWLLIRCIEEKHAITVSYYKASRALVDRKILPMAITFADYYFYLIAYHSDDKTKKPIYYRIDRIINIIVHRTKFEVEAKDSFDEGALRSKIQFMQPGEYRRIKFSFCGVSVQAILDKIPTARVVAVNGKTSIIEAETYGKGINMFLLSQGATVQALEPKEFVKEMEEEIEMMFKQYRGD